MIQAVVFDVGETLVNESRLWQLWAEWLNIPEHVFFAMLGAAIERGDHHHRVFEFLKADFRLEAAREERSKAGIPDRFNASDIYADVPECFAALRDRGLRIGIAGNQPSGLQNLFVDLGLPIDFVGSSTEWNIEKPAPAFFRKIIAELSVPPEDIAYVGDRLDNDVLPALDAGMIAIFIRRGPWGFLHARKPAVIKAHIRLSDLASLPAALDRLQECSSPKFVSNHQSLCLT